MILVLNKDTNTQLTFDNERLFELAKDFGNYEIVNPKFTEPEPITEIIEPVVIKKELIKTALKNVVTPQDFETPLTKDEPIKKKRGPAKK